MAINFNIIFEGSIDEFRAETGIEPLKHSDLQPGVLVNVDIPKEEVSRLKAMEKVTYIKKNGTVYALGE